MKNSDEKINLSIVIPLRDEAENLVRLYPALKNVLDNLELSYEIIFIDDGSRDDTPSRLDTISKGDRNVIPLRLQKSFGQTAALAAGFDNARGNVVVTMDGDLQNDPKDIPRLLETLEEGYDVVSGWRRQRRDPWFGKRLPSFLANGLIGLVTGVKLHDYGCTLKAYRLDVIRGIRLYGEMHRFLPALANMTGARITEVPVEHHPRSYGKSHYSPFRTIKVILDLLTVKFLSDYSTRPIHLFGTVGLILCACGIVVGGLTLWQKYVEGVWVHRNPLILLAVFLFLLGVGFTMMGLLAELIIRLYHESQKKPIYWIRRKKQLD